jgi:putative heme iron utilization protein
MRSPRAPNLSDRAMAESPYSADAVAAIRRHMNDDHAADNVVICRVLGGQPDATDATMTDMDPEGIAFTVVVDGRDVDAQVPWGTPPVTRGDVRTEVVRMYEQASGVLGLD